MLGDNIKRIREAKKISINALSKMCGISPGYLSDIEKNKKENPSIEILNKLSLALDVSLEDFFKIDNNDMVESVELNANDLDTQIKALYPHIQKLPDKDKEAILKIINAFIKDNNLKL